MSADAVPCRLCGHLIFFSENNISRSGIPIPMNFTNNKFGARGTNHNCRPTYKAPDPSKIDMRVFCSSCLNYHDRRIHPWCPCCWKLKCTKCGNMWIPTTLNIKCVDDEGEVYRECIACGSMEIEMVENVESWRIAWDKKEEIVGAFKCKNCKGKNWIGPPPINIRRSTKNKDPNRSTTIVSFVEDLPYKDWWKT